MYNSYLYECINTQHFHQQNKHKALNNFSTKGQVSLAPQTGKKINCKIMKQNLLNKLNYITFTEITLIN